jgi:hypothetical protein
MIFVIFQMTSAFESGDSAVFVSLCAVSYLFFLEIGNYWYILSQSLRVQCVPNAQVSGKLARQRLD